MSHDPRLVRWLEATRNALDSLEEQRVAALAELEETRAELEASLSERPPQEIAAALVEQLEGAEKELLSAVEALRGSLSDQVARLRETRGVLRDYRPANPNRPAFVSKSV